MAVFFSSYPIFTSFDFVNASLFLRIPSMTQCGDGGATESRSNPIAEYTVFAASGDIEISQKLVTISGLASFMKCESSFDAPPATENPDAVANLTSSHSFPTRFADRILIFENDIADNTMPSYTSPYELLELNQPCM